MNDHAMICWALLHANARWAPLPTPRHGEFCISGLRHCTELDDSDIPKMTPFMRTAIIQARRAYLSR